MLAFSWPLWSLSRLHWHWWRSGCRLAPGDLCWCLMSLSSPLACCQSELWIQSVVTPSPSRVSRLCLWPGPPHCAQCGLELASPAPALYRALPALSSHWFYWHQPRLRASSEASRKYTGYTASIAHCVNMHKLLFCPSTNIFFITIPVKSSPLIRTIRSSHIAISESLRQALQSSKSRTLFKCFFCPTHLRSWHRYIFAISAECLPWTGPASPCSFVTEETKNELSPAELSVLCENAARGPRLNKGVDRLSWGSGQRNFLDISADRWRWHRTVDNCVHGPGSARLAEQARAQAGRWKLCQYVLF